ncbi:C4-dicarboxylate TRAP transporter substrate-binding protein [Pseudooceanicola sp.]|uniref:C4-dicarboxylate TRAP transporter substrate-binding protein n=1 Tax=Pseudooceanicola sp. TaxID=1914328 RepID=UPI00260559F3|nr:C4-dicarboxylate TRAP transporter substrate-binding protein [Pseudooceanicola sp.]MDF1853869.1 C4-dicarboxylate TRAP transporter substrate-binding protein [Pseudooceanicola sp.]
MKTGLITAVTAALCLGLTGPSMAREITVGAYTAPGSTPNAKGLFPGSKRITEATNGELTFEIFTGGAMGGPKELLGNIGSGILDAGSVVVVYVKSALPTTDMLASLMVLRDDTKATVAAMNEMQLLHCPECKAELERNNVVGLSWTGIATVHMICRDPVKNLEELRRQKVIAPSGWGIAVKGLGATPISITTAEMYEAMQRGQADCAVGSPAWLDTYNLKDFSKELWSNPLGSYFGVMNWTFNRDVWNDLTDMEKKAFTDNLAQQVGDVTWGYEEDNNNAIATYVAANGPMTDPDQAFLDAWAEQQEKAVATAIEKGKSAGIPNAEKNVTTYIGLVAKWMKIIEESDGSKEAYVEALQREIFDKM